MKLSAGLLMYRKNNLCIEFLLVHPGGPFYKNKNEGVWSIPKGEPDTNEDDLLRVAQREFHEETGITPAPPFYPIGTVKTKAGKLIHAWSFEGTWQPDDGIQSNKIPIEWPPKSGKHIYIPEVDRAEWMTPEKASVMINPMQAPFLERAQKLIESVGI